MKIHDVLQGSPEWFGLRAGLPTASEFEHLITPKTMKPCFDPKTLKFSEASVKYRNRLLCEYVLGRTLDTGYQSPRMSEGNLFESEASNDFEFKFANGEDVTVVGFVTRDDGLVGCSPDRFVGTKGILELKVNSPAVHMGYLLNPDSLRQEHRCQTQGQLYVCDEREWVATMSYCKILNSSVVIRSEREPVFQDALHKALWEFIADLQEQRTYLSVNHAHLFVRPDPKVDLDANPFGITEDDVVNLTEQLWAASQAREAEGMK